MDLKDIIVGLFWLIGGNLACYLIYPLFGAMIDGMQTATVGEFALTPTVVAIGWGGYFLIWALIGVVFPLYMIIKGANRN